MKQAIDAADVDLPIDMSREWYLHLSLNFSLMVSVILFGCVLIAVFFVFYWEFD